MAFCLSNERKQADKRLPKYGGELSFLKTTYQFRISFPHFLHDLAFFPKIAELKVHVVIQTNQLQESAITGKIYWEEPFGVADDVGIPYLDKLKWEFASIQVPSLLGHVYLHFQI